MLSTGSEEDIRREFGDTVTGMILRLPDPFTQPEDMLAERMLAFRTAPSPVRFLWLCDMKDTVSQLKARPDIDHCMALRLVSSVDQARALSAYSEGYANQIPMLLEMRNEISELMKRVTVILSRP